MRMHLTCRLAGMELAVFPVALSGQTLKRLEAFGTRDIHSATDDPEHGIGAAQRWIEAQLKSYSPRLQVHTDTFRVKKQGRIQRDLDLVNVVAVLPGTTQADRQVLITAHYDSLVIVRKSAAAGEAETAGADWPASAAAPIAPGVNDDGSGTAAVLEIARVLSQKEWRKTLVFVLFAGEEQGLIGSRLMANAAKEKKLAIDAVLNSDIIGNEVAGNGQTRNRAVRVFSAEPSDSPSRALARYIQDVGERYVPSMNVDLIFRHDRFARGGDHTPFAQQGFAAVRFTTPAEDYSHQHTLTDNFENASPDYTARVARLKLAVGASLAMAPPAPDVTRSTPSTNEGVPPTPGPALGRGKSQYDAVLRWKQVSNDPVAGYAVVIRRTTSPFWEREIWAGDTKEFALKDFSIDDTVLGVKAVSVDGFESPVAAYIAVDTFSRPVALATDR